MCGGKNYFPIERENWTLEKAPKTRHNTIQNSRSHHHRVAAGAQRAFEGHTTHKKHKREEHKKRTKKRDVVVLRANEPNDDDLGAARTGIRDGEPGDGIPRGLVQQTRPLVLREMHR